MGSLKDGVIVETAKLDEVYKTIRDHNTYLVGQLETYKSYLHNVRSQSEGTRRKQQKQQVLGPYKFTHQQLEKEGVIQKSNVPDNRRANIYFNFTSPLPGTFVISLHYKGKKSDPPLPLFPLPPSFANLILVLFQSPPPPQPFFSLSLFSSCLSGSNVKYRTKPRPTGARSETR